MFSTSTLFSLVSLSLLSFSSMALPLQERNVISKCYAQKAGELCTINGQAYNSNTTYFEQNVTIKDSFKIDVRGKDGLSKAMRYLSLDFEGVANKEDNGFYVPSSEFHPVHYNISKNLVEIDFVYDDIKVPCGLDGKYFLNVSVRNVFIDDSEEPEWWYETERVCVLFHQTLISPCSFPASTSILTTMQIVGHSSAGVNNTVTVEEQRFGPFNVSASAC